MDRVLFGAIRQTLFSIAAAVSLVLCAAHAGAQEQVTVLRGATLIDVAAGRAIENSVVVMERGKFRSVGQDGRTQIPPGARVIDVKGKFLIPGLIDSHVHYRDWFGEILLANGITSVLDQANPTDWSIALKEAQQLGKARVPRFFVTGNQLDGSVIPTHFKEMGYADLWVSGGVQEVLPASTRITYSDAGRNYKTYLDDPDEARREVQRLVRLGVDAIKVHYLLTPPVLKAISDEAHRAGLAVVGHRWDARELAELGMDFVEHTSPVAIATITDPQKMRELKEGKLIDPHPFMDPAAFPALARTLVDKKIYFNPTLSGTWRGVTPRRKEYLALFEQYFGQPALKYIPRGYLKGHVDAYTLADRVPREQVASMERGYRNVEQFMKVFVDAGGKLLAASDPSRTGIPGLGIHHDMQLTVDAGISPIEALRSATIYPAELLRKEKALGTVEAGKLADLLVLGGDPLKDIDNTRTIEMVFLGGEQVDTSFHPDYTIPMTRSVADDINARVAPSIDNLEPGVTTQGGPDVVVELRGQGFLPTSAVTFNGSAVKSTFEGPSRVKATIPSSMLGSVGTYPIRITDAYGGQKFQSNQIFFVVKFPAGGVLRSER